MTREDMKDVGRKRAPIDRIFQEIVKRPMTPRERQILLPKPKKSRQRRKPPLMT